MIALYLLNKSDRAPVALTFSSVVQYSDGSQADWGWVVTTGGQGKRLPKHLTLAPLESADGLLEFRTSPSVPISTHVNQRISLVDSVEMVRVSRGVLMLKDEISDRHLSIPIDPEQNGKTIRWFY